MADIIADSMNSQFLGLPSFVWIAVLAIIIVVVWFRKPKKAEFKKLSAEQETKKRYKELLEAVGTDKINKKLLYGYEVKGLVGRCAAKSDKTKVYEVYTKKLGGHVRRWLNWKPKYWLIDNDAIQTINNKELVINPTALYNNDLGCITFGKNPKDILYDESYKVNNEQAINEMINWLPLQSYLSVQHAQSSEGLDHIAEIEKTKKEDMISEMTGKKKK